MLDIRNLLILPASLGDKMLLVEIKPWFELLDGKKTGNQLGYKYTISLPAHALDKIDVKVPGEQQIEKPDGYVEVEFTGLVVKPYYRDNSRHELAFSAKATGIRLADHK